MLQVKALGGAVVAYKTQNIVYFSDPKSIQLCQIQLAPLPSKHGLGKLRISSLEIRVITGAKCNLTPPAIYYMMIVYLESARVV